MPTDYRRMIDKLSILSIYSIIIHFSTIFLIFYYNNGYNKIKMVILFERRKKICVYLYTRLFKSYDQLFISMNF